MARKRPIGTCHFCGVVGPLSYERIPPQAAFGDRRLVAAHFEQVIHLGPDEMPRGRIQQSGIGTHTPYGKRNNDTGAWYGRQFVKWCYQGMDVPIRSNGNPRLIYLHSVYPLRVINGSVAQ